MRIVVEPQEPGKTRSSKTKNTKQDKQEKSKGKSVRGLIKKRSGEGIKSPAISTQESAEVKESKSSSAPVESHRVEVFTSDPVDTKDTPSLESVSLDSHSQAVTSSGVTTDQRTGYFPKDAIFMPPHLYSAGQEEETPEESDVRVDAILSANSKSYVEEPVVTTPVSVVQKEQSEDSTEQEDVSEIVVDSDSETPAVGTSILDDSLLDIPAMIQFTTPSPAPEVESKPSVVEHSDSSEEKEELQDIVVGESETVATELPITEVPIIEESAEVEDAEEDKSSEDIEEDKSHEVVEQPKLKLELHRKNQEENVIEDTSDEDEDEDEILSGKKRGRGLFKGKDRKKAKDDKPKKAKSDKPKKFGGLFGRKKRVVEDMSDSGEELDESIDDAGTEPKEDLSSVAGGESSVKHSDSSTEEKSVKTETDSDEETLEEEEEESPKISKKSKLFSKSKKSKKKKDIDEDLDEDDEDEDDIDDDEADALVKSSKKKVSIVSLILTLIEVAAASGVLFLIGNQVGVLMLNNLVSSVIGG